jgi:hypothetical protein
MGKSSKSLTSEKLTQRVAVERARMAADLDRMTRTHGKLSRAEQAVRGGRQDPGRLRKRQPEAGHGSPNQKTRAPLLDPSVRIFPAGGPHDITAPAVANRTGSLAGLSNVFTTTAPAKAAWSAPSRPTPEFRERPSVLGYQAPHMRLADPSRTPTTPGPPRQPP